jgi:hypothetical protein
MVQFQPPVGLDSYPNGLAFDKKGNAWATVGFSVEEIPSSALKTLQRNISPAPKAKITSSSFNQPFGCSFDPLGNLWVADGSGALFELSKKQLLPGTKSVKPAHRWWRAPCASSPQIRTTNSRPGLSWRLTATPHSVEALEESVLLLTTSLS